MERFTSMWNKPVAAHSQYMASFPHSESDSLPKGGDSFSHEIVLISQRQTLFRIPLDTIGNYVCLTPESLLLDSRSDSDTWKTGHVKLSHLIVSLIFIIVLIHSALHYETVGHK